MYTACQFSSLGVRCGNCAKCNLAAAIAERDAYRAVLEALVGVQLKCERCGAPATATVYRYPTPSPIPFCALHGPEIARHETPQAKALRAAIALLNGKGSKG